MKNTFLFTTLLSVCFLSCKKDESPNLTQSIVGTWKFISETNVGGYDGNAESYNIKGASFEKIIYNADGTAHSSIQGQIGFQYKYELNEKDKSLFFQFVRTDYPFMVSQPCLSTTGCLHRTFIKKLTSETLVLENTFYQKINGVDRSLKIIDSFARQ